MWSGRSHDSGFAAAGRLAGRLVAGTACGAASPDLGQRLASRTHAPLGEPGQPRSAAARSGWSRKAAVKKPTPPPPSRPASRASFHLGRLCWMCLSSMERTQLCKSQARRSRSGGLPWAYRSGGRTGRGALRRAPCYRGVSKREAAVHLGAPPHRILPGVRFGADCSSRRPARSAASADIFRGRVAIQWNRLSRRLSASTLWRPLESSGA